MDDVGSLVWNWSVASNGKHSTTKTLLIASSVGQPDV